jgi:hypothetical protein
MKMLVLAVSAIVVLPAPSAPAAGRELNTLVARIDRARGPAPADCEQGLSTEPVLRVDVGEIPVPEAELAEAPAPPSGALRAALQETQSALTRNDRPAFDAALSRARSLLATYPTGAERRTAENIVRLHDAAGRLWSAQYESPFFGEDDPVYTTVSAWPGYGEAVRRSLLTDRTGRRFYPAAESRDFATRLAAERLQRLGIHPATSRPITRIASEDVRIPAARSPASTSRKRPTHRSTASTPAASRPTTSRSAASRSAASTSAASTPAASTSAASTPAAPRTPPSRKPAVASHTPGPPNRPAPPTATAVPEPAPPAMTADTSVAPPSPAPGETATATATPLGAGGPVTPAVDPVSETAAETAPETVSATPDTATTAVSTDTLPGAEPAGAGRSVILPAILILVGLGVLIVLFRASK